MSDFNQNEPIKEEPTPSPAEIPVEETSEASGNSVAEAAIPPSPVRSKACAELLDYIEIFVLAISIVILLFSFVFRVCTVDGESMEDTLYGGESLVVSNLFYTPERGDVIVFHQTGALNEPVVKRVIATAGETVHIQYLDGDMTVTVTDADGNKIVLDEEYMKYVDIPLYRASATYRVGEGQIFVLGDNRNHSKDSRHPDIGLVDTRRVLGKVLFRITPLSRIGVVE